MLVPEPVAALLRGAQAVGELEQAFPLLTVDADSFPHVALLSRSELDVSPDRAELLAVVASPRTLANLERSGRATVIAVEGVTAHSVKLRLCRTIRRDFALGLAFEAIEHKADSLNTMLTPITYRTSASIAVTERWKDSAALLAVLQA